MAERFSFVRTGQSDAFSPSNLESLIVEAAPLARSLTSKPLPHIAIGLGSSGRVFIGMDVELPGLPLSFSIHAEQFLVLNLILNQEPKLHYLAISNDGYSFFGPCGQCCQFLQEIHKGNEIQTLITEPTGLSYFKPLDRLLPQKFSPYSSNQDYIHVNLQDVFQQRFSIYVAAIEAHKRSYAPYTNAPSGVALTDNDGKVYSGSYIESVASITSLGPVQAALIHFVIETGGRDFVKIVEAVLVERSCSPFPQADTAKMILNKIVPGCTFNVYYFP